MYNGRQVVKQGNGFGAEQNAFASDEKICTWTSASRVHFDHFKNTMVRVFLKKYLLLFVTGPSRVVYGVGQKSQGNGCTIKTPTPIPE